MQIIDNFNSSMNKFLDNRQVWDSLEELKNNIDIKMPKGFQVYCKLENKWFQMYCTDEDNPDTYEWKNIEGSNILFYDTYEDLPEDASKDDLAYVRGFSTVKALIDVDSVAKIINRHPDIYLYLNNELKLGTNILNGFTAIYLSNSDASTIYYYLSSSGLIDELKKSSESFEALSPKVGDWVLTNSDGTIEIVDFDIPFNEEKVKEQIGEEESKQLKSELLPPEKTAGSSGLFTYNGNKWISGGTNQEVLIETNTLPEELKNAIYKVGNNNLSYKELTFISKSIGAPFAEGSKIPSGVGIYQLDKDFDITIDGVHIDIATVKSWTDITGENRMFGKDVTMDSEGNIFLEKLPSFAADIDDSTCVLYVFSDKNKVSFESNKTLITGVAMVDSNSVTNIPDYISAIKTNKDNPTDTSFETSVLSYDASTRQLTNKTNTFTSFGYIIDTSMLPTKNGSTEIYAKDVKLATYDDLEKVNVDNIPVYTTEEYEQIKDTIPEGTKFIISDDYQEEEGKGRKNKAVFSPDEIVVHSINHRGANDIAPENTISAFRISKELGFNMVECDVDFTSDNFPVIIHDATVDRTSNGSGDVHSFTFENVRKLDFGSWKSSIYTGEKIPSFEEFIICCRTLGLHPYIEIKERDYIDVNLVKKLVDTVRVYNMQNKVTWISFGLDKLQSVVSLDKHARVGYIDEFISSDTLDESINKIKTIDTGFNEIFYDLNLASVNSTIISRLKTEGIPLEVWTVDNTSLIANADSYITGFTSNKLRADWVLRDIKYSDGDDLDFVDITSQVQKTEYVDELLRVQVMRKNGYVFIKCYCTMGNVPADQKYHDSDLLVTGIPKKYIPYMDVSLAAMGWGYESDGKATSKICRISVTNQQHTTPGCVRISESNMVKGDRLRAEWSYPITYYRSNKVGE